MLLLNKIRDKLRLLIYRKLYDFENNQNSKLNWRNIESIIIFKVDGKLGDTQIISPFLKTIQREYPKINITVICPLEISDIYYHCLKTNVLICSTRPSKKELSSITSKIKNCDLFITIEEKFRFHDFYILYLLKPRFIAGINNSVKSINIRLNNNYYINHITDYFNNLLQIGGIPSEKIIKSYTPLITETAKKSISPLCKKPQISFAPWGASKHRRLNDNVIVEIAKLITKNNYNLALLIPFDGIYLKHKIQKEINQDLLIKIPDKITIYELSALIQNSEALISVDTANIHLACAFKTPIFGIYNGNKPYPWILWGPEPSRQNTEIFYVESKFIDELSFKNLERKILQFLEFLQ